MASLLQELLGPVLQYPTLSLLLLVLLLVAGSYYAIRPRNLPPGPWGIPWIGSPHLFGDDLHKDFNRLAQKYGPVFTLMMGTRPMIIINTNALIKEAFIRRADVFSNRPTMYALDHVDLFDELFNAHYSDVWKEKKKIMTRIHQAAGFGSPCIEPYFQKVLDRAFVEFDKFEGKAFVAKDILHNMMCMTIIRIVYGADFQFDDPELLYVRKFCVDWVDCMFRGGMNLGYWIDNVPCWITKRLFPKTMSSMKKVSNEFQDFLVKKIEEHREAYDPEKDHDIMDGYIKERGNDKELTDQIMASTILMLFPDAVDSAGIFLEFITFYLAYYPEWQLKVQYQIAEVCGNRRPVLTDRPNLSFVEATMYEVGRIVNVVCVSIAHSTQRDITFEGYNIPEDCYILANHWAAHLEKDLFPQGDEFIPETLINSEEKLQKNTKIMFFGAGRRMCIGEQLVKNQTFMYISSMLQRYNVQFPEDEPLPSRETRGGLIREPMPFKIQFLRRQKDKQ